MPVGSPYLGKTYEQWSVEWWKWAESIPVPINPILDETGKSSGIGQSGSVWFLAGTSGATKIERKAEIPAGKAIFFPIINVVATKDKDLNTEQKMRDAAKAYIDHVTVKEVKVDGKKLKNLDNFRVGSKLFLFTSTVKT